MDHLLLDGAFVVPLTIVCLLVLFVVLLVVLGLKIIQQSETMVIERLGKFHRVLPSGVNIIWPVIDRPRSIEWRYLKVDVDNRTIVRKEAIIRIDLRETVYDFPKQNVITRDNVAIEINALLYFQITDARRAVYEIANLPDAIEKLTQTTLRNVIGELDLDHTLSSRDTINKKLRAILDEASDKWGVKVNRVELLDIMPPEDVKQAMEKQMRAERDRRATILSAEGAKQAQILDAEGIRQSEISKAEGMKQSIILRAEAEAEARIKTATAEAEAIGHIANAVGQSPRESVQYMVALKYIEAFKSVLSGKEGKTLLLPYEASGLLGSIAGIRELLGAAAVDEPRRSKAGATDPHNGDSRSKREIGTA
jgi:regulator of protease activity HflC (stomatin/prohibitin superfamily)